MLLKEAQYKETKQMVRTRISEEIYGCDVCKLEIDMDCEGSDYLDLRIHFNDRDSKHMQLCSWECVLEILPKIKTDYFVSLPLLMYDTKKKGMRAKDLISLLKKVK